MYVLIFLFDCEIKTTIILSEVKNLKAGSSLPPLIHKIFQFANLLQKG